MSLIIERSEHAGFLATKCHICHNDLGNKNIVEHTGNVLMFPQGPERAVTEWSGGIAMHQECAVILMLRLAADVMRVRALDNRVPDKLKAIQEAQAFFSRLS